jgi:putative ABC transport system permease protein
MGSRSSAPTLKRADADAIQREIRGVKATAPLASQNSTVVNGNANWSTSIVGTTENYFTVREWKIAIWQGIHFIRRAFRQSCLCHW